MVDVVEFSQTVLDDKSAVSRMKNAVFWTALDEAGGINGGGGGNRTRVQKHSTDSSTYLALPFDLTRTTRTRTLR
jgi:hypothetical protein